MQKEAEPQIWVRGWFPVLFGLSRIINRCKLDVRTRALTVMFEVMKMYGDRFMAQWWTDLFRVVFRIFDDKKLAGMSSQQEQNEWMSTTCTLALRSIIDVVSQFFDILQGCVLAELLTLLEWCITRHNESLARTGTECLHILVMNNGFNFTDDSWAATCTSLQRLFQVNEPTELLEYGNRELQRLQQEKAQRAANKTAAAPGAGAATKSENNEQGGKTQDQTSDETAKQANGTPQKQNINPVEEAAREADVTPLPKAKPSAAKQAEERSRFQATFTKCVVQLELIQTIEWIVLSSTRPESTAPPKRSLSQYAVIQKEHHTPGSVARVQSEERSLAKHIDEAGEMFECLSADRLFLLLDCLLRSHRFAQNFNSNDALRTALWQAGYMRNRSKPNLFKQETTSLACGLKILFRMYEAEQHREVWSRVEGQIVDVCRSTLHLFLTAEDVDDRALRSTLIALILREVLVMPDERFVTHAGMHYTSFVECLTLAFDGKLGELSFLLAAFFNRARPCAL